MCIKRHFFKWRFYLCINDNLIAVMNKLHLYES